jgi:predicted Zn-dependent protease
MLITHRTVPRSLAITAILLLGLAPTALGFNLNGYRAGENNVVTFNRSQLTTTIFDAFNYNDVNNIEPTDISTTLFTDDTPKEVNIYDYDYGDTGWYGRWFCNTLKSGTLICLDGRVQINLYWSYTVTQARSLVCEEVGHSVGLSHSAENASCMSQQWDKTLLSSHDRAQLSNKY